MKIDTEYKNGFAIQNTKSAQLRPEVKKIIIQSHADSLHADYYSRGHDWVRGLKTFFSSLWQKVVHCFSKKQKISESKPNEMDKIKEEAGITPPLKEVKTETLEPSKNEIVAEKGQEEPKVEIKEEVPLPKSPEKQEVPASQQEKTAPVENASAPCAQAQEEEDDDKEDEETLAVKKEVLAEREAAQKKVPLSEEKMAQMAAKAKGHIDIIKVINGAQSQFMAFQDVIDQYLELFLKNFRSSVEKVAAREAEIESLRGPMTEIAEIISLCSSISRETIEQLPPLEIAALTRKFQGFNPFDYVPNKAEAELAKTLAFLNKSCQKMTLREQRSAKLMWNNIFRDTHLRLQKHLDPQFAKIFKL